MSERAGVHNDGASHRPAGAVSPTVRSDLAEEVAAALSSMAPPGVRTGSRAIGDVDVSGLFPSEREAIANAVTRRRSEFAAGRALLRDLIGDDVEIPVGPDRRPVFPSGVSGTLAHDIDVVVAAVTRGPGHRALGVDIEPVTVFDEASAEIIRRPEERHLDAHLVFVLKEAAYKAWSSTGGGFLEHRDVRVDVDASGTFRAQVIPAARWLTGRYAQTAGRCLALVVDDGTG